MSELFTTILTVSVSLCLVLLLAYAALWLMRRFQLGTQSGSDGSQPVEFIRSLPIGPRERVTLVSCNGKTYLLGVTSASITCIDSWADAEDDTGLPH